MKNIKKFLLGLFLIVSLLAVGSLSPIPPPNLAVAATNAIPTPIALFQTSLASGITSTATSMTLVSARDKDGNTLSGTYAFIIDEGTANEEFVNADCTGTACTNMSRGLSVVTGTTSITALKKSHGRGASVKITDAPQLMILHRIINGISTFPNPITYASGIGPVSGSDLADKEYVLSVVSGGTITYDKVTVAGTAGETLAAGNLVYLKSSDSRWWKTAAGTASTVENVPLGIAQGSGTAGSSITGGVLVKGVDANQSGLSTNTIYYASNTSGALSSSAGTKKVVIGISLSTTSILFAPRYNQQLTADQQDALAGTSGTPSTSNKYVTDADTSAVGVANKVVRADAAGVLASTVFDTSKMPIPTFQQTLPTAQGGTALTPAQLSSTASPDGSVLYTYDSNNASLSRFARDAQSGEYYLTHSIDPTISIPSGDIGSLVYVSPYIYFFSNDGTNLIASRFSATDLTGEQAMTVPTITAHGWVLSWTDGTFVYLTSDANGSASTTSRKWSISGTSMVAVTTGTFFDNQFPQYTCGTFFDGTTAYFVQSQNSYATTFTISKFGDALGTSATTTTVKTKQYAPSGDEGAIAIPFNSNKMYVGRWSTIFNAAAQLTAHIILTPVTKP